MIFLVHKFHTNEIELNGQQANINLSLGRKGITFKEEDTLCSLVALHVQIHYVITFLSDIKI